MANVYDAIVIGGGHNGLIGRRVLREGGRRTVVLEARDKTGGAADTSSPWPEHPDFKVTTYSYVMSLMPPTIIRELQLERHGYKVTPFGPYYQAYPDGRSIKVYADDAKKNYESISQVLEEGRRDDAEVGRVAVGRRRRPGAAAAAGPAEARLDGARRPDRPAQGRVEARKGSASAASATSRGCSR